MLLTVLPLTIQLVVAAFVVRVVWTRTRSLLYRAPLELGPYLKALLSSIERGALDEARRLAERAVPAWAGQIAATELGAPERGDGRELLLDLSGQAAESVSGLRSLARIATAVGLLIAIMHLVWLWSGDHGLLELQAGLPARMAAQGALQAMVVGLATSFFAHYSLGWLRKGAKEALGQARRTLDALESASPQG